MRKANQNFDEFRDTDLLSLGNTVFDSFTGNAYFPDPVPALPGFKVHLDDFGKAITTAADGSKKDIAIRKAARVAVDADLRSLSLYANLVAMGNEVMLASTSLPLNKERTPQNLQMPEIKGILQGNNAGEMIIRVKRPIGAVSFRYEVVANPTAQPAEWHGENSKLASFTFTGLEEGKLYWFRVQAVGKGNQQLTCDAIPMYVDKRTIVNTAA